MKSRYIPPAPKGFIERIAAKLGYTKTIPSGLGNDLVDAVSTLNDQIVELDTVETLGVSKITMATAAIEGANIGTKNKHTVNLLFHTTAMTIYANGDEVGMLDNGIKPVYSFYTPAYNYADGKILGAFFIYNTGKILFYGDPFTSKKVMCACTYLI